MAHGQHDTIAYRLSQILIKLNQGDHLDPAELADEFGTHVRTIQRDLKVRLAYLPLLKTRGRYHLEAVYLGKLNFKDIERFSALAGVKGLFPSLSREFGKVIKGMDVVGKIRSVQVQIETFSRDTSVETSIQTEEGIWHSPQSQKVLLSVAPEAAEYFKRRQLIPHQEILRETADGALIVETTVGHPNQILPIVRYWIPSVRILSPEEWHEHLVEQLSGYLNDLSMMQPDADRPTESK